MIWVSGRSAPICAAKAHRRAESKTDGNFWRLHIYVWLGSIASGSHRHGRWDLVLPVRSGIKTVSMAWCSLNSKKESKNKTLLIVFLDYKGIIHKESAPAGQTINAAFYQSVLNRLLQRIRWIRPKVQRTGKWMQLHDNAPAHSEIRVRQFLA